MRVLHLNYPKYRLSKIDFQFCKFSTLLLYFIVSSFSVSQEMSNHCILTFLVVCYHTSYRPAM